VVRDEVDHFLGISIGVMNVLPDGGGDIDVDRFAQIHPFWIVDIVGTNDVPPQLELGDLAESRVLQEALGQDKYRVPLFAKMRFVGDADLYFSL
jgi:hypothetical protein